MQQYQCIKQPKGFVEINFERKIFNFIKELLYPPKNVKVVRLYCEELKYYIQIKKEDFIECFVKYPYETNTPQKETKEMDKIQMHKELCEELNEIYNNEDEINEAIVSGYMGEKELVLYKRFVLYRKKQDLNNLVVTIDSLNELTSTVSDNYEERAECIRISNLIRGEISKVDACLRDVPNIRVSSAYNSVKIDYRKYFDAYIKSGMDRATYTEGIDKIQRSGVIIRGLKSRKLKQLKQGLKEHNVSSKENVEYLYNQYIDSLFFRRRAK